MGVYVKDSGEKVSSGYEREIGSKFSFLFKTADRRGLYFGREVYTSETANVKTQAIQQQLQVFAQTLHTLKSSIEELKKTVEGKQPTDIEIIEQQVEALKTQYEEAFAQYNQSKAWEQAAQDLHNELETSKSKEAELEKTYGKIANLYDIVRGQNHLKISFERYIQIEYLERIIQAANIRLREPIKWTI